MPETIIKEFENAKIELIKHKKDLQNKVVTNIGKALHAMGMVGIELISDQMMKGYGKPIYLTGDLMRSITYKIDIHAQTTTWGSNLNYAPAVHDGTSRMPKRPFLTDAILGNKEKLKEVAAEELAKNI